MHLQSFVCLLWPVLAIHARQCGFPGQLQQGTVHPNKSAYNEGEFATYTCDTGYYFKYNSTFLKWTQRTCQDTGLWNGTIPACDYYDVISNAFIIPLGLNDITDERYNTCARVNRATFDTNRHNQTTEITALFRTVHSGPMQILVRLGDRLSPRQATVSVQVMDYPNQCSRVSISNSGIEFASTCNITNKGDNHGVRLAFTARRYWSPESPLSICSLKGLILTGNDDCEELQRPAYGTVSRNSSNIATYYCDEGHEILGEPQRECTWSVQRKKYIWTGTAPVCALKSFPASEKRSAYLFFETPTTLMLLSIIAVIVWLNMLYCLVRYCRKKPKARSPQLEVKNQQNENLEVHVEPEVLPLKSVSRDGRNLPGNSGRSSMNVYEENAYTEMGLLPVFPTAQTTTAQHLYNNTEPCGGANEGGKPNFHTTKIPIQQHSSDIDTYRFFSSNTKEIDCSEPLYDNIPMKT